MIATSPNFALLDVSRPDVARLVAAMVTAQKALVPLSETGCRSRRRRQMQQQIAPAASGRLVPKRNVRRLAARQRPRPDAEIAFGGRVDEEVAHPHPSQTRMCRFPASGSSWKSLAHGGADDTIRDSPAKNVGQSALVSILASSATRCRFVDRFVRLKVLSRVSRQRFSPHGTPLSSIGSR
jgi:hypothetical protein